MGLEYAVLWSGVCGAMQRALYHAVRTMYAALWKYAAPYSAR